MVGNANILLFFTLVTILYGMAINFVASVKCEKWKADKMKP